MRVYLNGGPADGREISVTPGTIECCVAIPPSIDVPYPFNQPLPDSMPDYDIVRYVFRGTGFVDIDGVCSALIFDYQRTTNG